MKSSKSWFVVLVSLVLGFSSAAVAVADSTDITWNQLNRLLSQYDLKWSEVPHSRGTSAFLGNGMLGATIWAAREEALHWRLARCDVYDTDPRGRTSRVPVGKLVLRLKGRVLQFSMHQSLPRAEVTGLFKTDQGQVQWRAIIPHVPMVGLIEYTTEGNEQVGFDFVQLPAVNYNMLMSALRKELDAAAKTSRKYRRLRRVMDLSDPAYKPFLEKLAQRKKLFRNPPSQTGQTQGIHWLIQPLKFGGGFVVAWGVQQTGGNSHLCVYTIDYFRTGKVSADRAVQLIQHALKQGYRSIAEQHYRWWQQFYSKSFVTVPNREVERFYWLQVYKMGAATREDGVVLDQMGPWPRPSPWARIWCNINVQIAYHSMMNCNHLELCRPFLKLLDNNWNNFAAAIPDQYKTEGAIAVGRTMDIFGHTRWWAEFGDLTWMLHDYWMICRRTGDDQRMKEKLFPLLKGAARFMMAGLKKDEQGVYHFVPDISPEYSNERYPDTNYNLALLRWNLKTLLYLNKKFGLHDSEAARWNEVLSHLAPHPVDENGTMVAAGVPFAHTHRHYSHLLLFFPLRIIDIDTPEGRALFQKSYDHWVKLAGPQYSGWNSFSFFGAACMAAWLGNGEQALTMLLAGGRTATPSTFFGGAGPAVESVLFQTVGLTEMLLQSATTNPDEYRVRVFPAIPRQWKNVRFEHLPAEGGFDVSAELKDGRLQFVKIKSLAGKPCVLEADFQGRVQTSGARKIQLKRSGRRFQLNLKKGETVTLSSVGGA